MDATLRNVADQNNTNSPLKLSTTLVQTTSTLQITTNDNPYIDAEDGAGNNRFTIGRAPLSQQVNVDFASNPTGSTTIVGGIRTYKDGVNLATTMVFREDGYIGIGETTNPSGLLHVDGGANIPRMILDADTNVARIFSFRTNDTQRWAFRIDDNETGSNAGSNFAIRRYNDAGTFIDAPLNITRDSGNIGVNTTTTTGAKLTVKGTGSTSATTSLQVQNSAGIANLQITDDGSVFNYGKGGITTNTAFGRIALINNTTGLENTAFGVNTLNVNTTGQTNTAIGINALSNNTTGSYNTAVGPALAANINGGFNVGIGLAALNANTSGSENIAIGRNAIFTGTGNSNSVAIGRDALYSGTANSVAIGYGALLTNGRNNSTAVGYEAARSNSQGGTDTTAIGYQALRNLTSTGNNNTAVGYQSGLNIAGGYDNTSIGKSSLLGTTTGAQNVAVGFDALSLNTTGGNNTAVGYGTQSGNFNGSLILGHGAIATANNQAVFGSAAVNAGAVTSEVNTSTQVWNVIINGVARKILLA